MLKKHILIMFFAIQSLLFSSIVFAQDPGDPDTAIVQCEQWVTSNSQVVLNVYVVNDSSLGGFTIPLSFPDSLTHLDITCDSISRAGTRSESAAEFSDSLSIDNDKNRLNVWAIWFTGGLTPGDTGDGPVAKIFFSTGPSWDSSQYIPVDSTFFPPSHTLTFAKMTGEEYTPAFVEGCLGTGEWPSRDDTLVYVAYSPVDLIVTDPVGDSIGIDFNTIQNATYIDTVDVNEDGDLDDLVKIPYPLIGEYQVRVIKEPEVDTGHYSLHVKLDGNEETPMLCAASVPEPGEVDSVVYEVFFYLKGDANCDGKTSISDVIYLINYLFKGGEPPCLLLLGDANCCLPSEGANCEEINVTVSDVVYLINYLFKGGDPPCS